MKLQKFKEKNRKKVNIILFTIGCILLIGGVFFYSSFALYEVKEEFNVIKGNVESPGEIYFAYYVDDVITTNMPTKTSGYTLSSKSSCTNGVTIDWNGEKWLAEVDYSKYQKESLSKTKCNLYFEKFSEILVECGKNGKDASICIKEYGEKSSEIVNDGTLDHNLRYIGQNPNNYIDIGDKDAAGEKILWRIIGSFNNIQNKIDNSLETRIKIRREKTIGEYSWDTSNSDLNNGSGVNEWSSAKLNTLLNDYYYNSLANQTCYINSMNRTTPCDFSSTGLSVEAKKYIEEALWNTGSNGEELEEDKIKAGKFYDLERSINTGKICALNNNCNDNVERTTKWTGKIGLIYPSDFGFATSGGNTINRATCLEKNLYEWDSNMRDCIENNWLLDNTSFQWTITPSAYHNLEAKNSAFVAFRINKDGIVYGSYTYNKFLVYPTTYLKANVKILSGTGEKENPYVVSLSE